jgi:hypothetical protein
VRELITISTSMAALVKKLYPLEAAAFSRTPASAE